MPSVLYVYAITRDPVTPEAEGVDGARRYGTTDAGTVCAVHSGVSAEEFSQDAIDQRATDLEWLGAVGYRHQAVVSELMKRTAIVPLRAFTLFRSDESLRNYLQVNHAVLTSLLDRLDAKHEWTLRIELEPSRWSDALVRRSESLRELQQEIDGAPPGKAFLLRKKLDEEKKRASRTSEEALVIEIEKLILAKTRCETIAESRESRGGAFPQINILIDRDHEGSLEQLQNDLNDRYAGDGVVVALSGPWPPYTFAMMADAHRA